MKTLRNQWLKGNSAMLFNAASLIGTTAVTSLLGFAYWWAAARLFPPEAVGLSSAAISAMTLLGTIGILGFGTLLMGELPRQEGKEVSLIGAGLVIVGVVSMALGIVFAVLAPWVAVDLQPIRASVGDVLLFALGGSLTAVTIVLDQALIGLLRGEVQFWRNTLFAVVKLVALFGVSLWISREVGMAIYGTWTLGNLLSLLALVPYAIWKGKWFKKSDLPQWGLLHRLGPEALKHHFLNLTLQAPTLILPVLVTVLLSTATNAWFYVSWRVAGFVFVVPTVLPTVLYAVSAAQPAVLAQKTRLTLTLSISACFLASILLLLDTKQVLGLFGSVYADQAEWSLRILTLGAFPLIIKDHYVAICRVHSRMAKATLPMLAGCSLELVAAAIGAHFAGLSGLSLGWLIAMCIEAVFMFRTVYKAVRPALMSEVIQELEEAVLPVAETPKGMERLDADAVWLVDTQVLPAYYAELRDNTNKLRALRNGTGQLRDDDDVGEETHKMSAMQKIRRQHGSNGNTLHTATLPQEETCTNGVQAEPGTGERDGDDVSKEDALVEVVARAIASDALQHNGNVQTLAKPANNVSAAHLSVEPVGDMQQLAVLEEDARLVAVLDEEKNGVQPVAVVDEEGKDTPPEPDALKQQKGPGPRTAVLERATVKATQGLRSLASLKLIDVVCVLLPVGAFLLWSFSLQSMHVRNMTSLGVVSIMPPAVIISLVVIIVSFCLCLRQPQLRIPIILLHFALLIFMLYGVTALIEEAPRFAVTYRHAGYTEYIMRTGSVDPNLDAYFNWPGFFIWSALVTKAAGYTTILSYAVWAPIFLNLIYFGPMYMIFTSATTDKRLIWLALWFFYLTNWIAQDYFSPQGLNFFLYLVVIAILLKWFKVTPTAQPATLGPRWRRLGRFLPLGQRVYAWMTAPDALRTSVRPRQRTALLVVLLAVFVLIVYSHPLTPFFTAASVTALVVLRRCTPRWLPVVMWLMTILWIIFMAQTFLSGHMYMVTGDFGHFSSAVTQNVTSRLIQGDSGHVFVATLRIIMTLFVWGLAFLGGLLRLRRGHRDITYIVLAVVSFPLLLAQSYGGEMLLRIYLFTLPFMVLFAAAIFHTTSTSRISWWTTAATLGMCLLLFGGFLFTRYGNESMDYMTNDELAGVHYLYNVAPPRSLFLEGWDGTPWQFQGYEQYATYSLAEDVYTAAVNKDAGAIIRFIESKKYTKAYVIFTRSQKVTADLTSGLPPGLVNQVENALLSSGRFRVLYSNPDAQVLLFIDARSGGTP